LPTADLQPTCGLIVSKEKIAANGDYGLSGERYRESGDAPKIFVFQSIGDIADEIKAGFASGHSSVDTIGIPHIRPMNITDKGQFTWDGLKQIAASEYVGKEEYALRSGDVLFNNTNSKDLVGKTCLIEKDIGGGYSNHMTRIRVKSSLCASKFLAMLLHNAWQKGVFLELANRWVGQAGINATALAHYQIPLPPLELQEEIVAEIEGYQKVIDGARAVLDNYRPHIPIHPDWPMVELGEVCSTSSGGTPLSRKAAYYEGGTIPWLRSGEVAQGNVFHSELFITKEGLKNSSAKVFPINTVLVAMYGATAGEVGILRFEAATNQAVCGITPDEQLSPDFLYLFLKTDKPALIRLAGGGAQPNISQKIVREFRIPLPPLDTQQAIVAEIEAEQALVAANRELITRFEKKIQATLARVWGES
jgi:type I restriction enzyme M protein